MSNMEDKIKKNSTYSTNTVMKFTSFLNRYNRGKRKSAKRAKTMDGDEEFRDERMQEKGIGIDPNTQFIRNVSHRMGIDSLTKVSPTSSVLSTSPGNNIPKFVEQLFVIGSEYNRKMKDVVEYASVCNGEFVSVEGPLLVRNLLSNASRNAIDRMKNLSDIEPLVNMEIESGIPVSELIGDGPAITGIIQELIFNGLRHSFDDEVYVRVWPDKYKNTRVYVSVENTGILVSPEDIPSIFEPFTSTSNSKGNVRGEGVGLGLARSKLVADVIKGDLTVETHETTMFKLGITFKHSKDLVFNAFPLDVNHERSNRCIITDYGESYNECDELTRTSKHGCIKVLVVDDSPMILKMFDKMLNRIGVNVEVCPKPLVALEKVKLEKYDAIFLDVIMPVMTGIMCAHNIRQGETVNKNTPIIVVTADMSTETRQLTTYISDSILLEKPARLSVVTRSLISVIKNKVKTEYLREYCE